MEEYTVPFFHNNLYTLEEHHERKVTPFSMPYFFQVYSDGLLWAVEDDSAALLTRQSEFLQMVINEVQHRVH